MTEDPALYGNLSPLDRVLAAAECRTQADLAAFLGIKQSSVSDAKKRNAIPAEWLIVLLRRKGVNPEWIVTGMGPKHLGPASNEPPVHVVYHTAVKPPKECSLEELFTELVRRTLAHL